MQIPTIYSQRLCLRPPTIGDFAASLAMWRDPAVVRHIGGKPNTEEEVWSRLLRSIGHWAALGYGFWAVEALADSAYVGEVGFGEFRRECAPRLESVPEMGWVLAPFRHGRGYATEAGAAALAWRAERGLAGATVCIIDPGNAPSLRVAAKLGFVRTGTAMYRGAEIVTMRREAMGESPAGSP